MNYKRVLIIVFTIAFLIISIKPVLFTYHLIFAKYYQYSTNVVNSEYNYHFVKAVYYNPSYIEYLDKELFLRTALLEKEKEWIKKISLKAKAYFEAYFKNNLYFHYLQNGLQNKRIWKNLDSFTINMFNNKLFNSITILIFQNQEIEYPEAQLYHLVDLLNWKGNKKLSDFFIEYFHLKKSDLIFYPQSSEYEESYKILKVWAIDRLQLKSKNFNSNIIKAPGVTKDTALNLNGKISKDKHIHRVINGWFDVEKNGCLRSSYFNPLGKKNSSYKVVLKKKIFRFHQRIGRYFFSFDYLTQTDDAVFKLRIGSGSKTHSTLPNTNGQWFKVLLIIDMVLPIDEYLDFTVFQKFEGTVLVDNVFCSYSSEEEIERFGLRKLYVLDIKNFLCEGK